MYRNDTLKCQYCTKDSHQYCQRCNVPLCDSHRHTDSTRCEGCESEVAQVTSDASLALKIQHTKQSGVELVVAGTISTTMGWWFINSAYLAGFGALVGVAGIGLLGYGTSQVIQRRRDKKKAEVEEKAIRNAFLSEKKTRLLPSHVEE